MKAFAVTKEVHLTVTGQHLDGLRTKERWLRCVDAHRETQGKGAKIEVSSGQ